ncbi:MarR family winged helix-turn-helix transcriptional regulator [Microbacterium oleivorans]|uniref:MarR family transcriptional regulator n=1 Tax=Microbacterium oleivorans TaxID=273677 RepID=A0A4R5YL46_9MICO|nr:MarR family transcriptional regulator [Microbacterium oleivorans]TDL45976.1 MarR family transcriptional regulator [Microbacterium oleivorans]
MADVDAQTSEEPPATAGYWYDESPGQRERARRVLEALRTYRAAESAMRRRTRDSMSMGENELLALRYLLRQPDHSARPAELVKYLGVTSASITTMLDRLEKTGRIERLANPADRRSIFVKATTHANEEVRETLGRMHGLMYDVAVGMSPEAQEHVVDFLRRMSDAVDGVDPVVVEEP